MQRVWAKMIALDDTCNLNSSNAQAPEACWLHALLAPALCSHGKHMPSAIQGYLLLLMHSAAALSTPWGLVKPQPWTAGNKGRTEASSHENGCCTGASKRQAPDWERIIDLHELGA